MKIVKFITTVSHLVKFTWLIMSELKPLIKEVKEDVAEIQKLKSKIKKLKPLLKDDESK